MRKIHYMETGSIDPAYNLAFEEYILKNRCDEDYLLLWQNENAIVIGQNQNTEEEINRRYVDVHHIKVIRRITGGGAVYHDLGNLNYSFITDVGDLERFTARQFIIPVVNALQGLGLKAEASGRNDILIEGIKVSGMAQRLMNGRILHHGTLLFQTDPSIIESALHVDPIKFESKGIKSVKSRVGCIRQFLSNDMEMYDFWNYLKGSLIKKDFVEDHLSEKEIEAVKRLKADKYDTWEWNFGLFPQYNISCKRKWPGGILEIKAQIINGKIEEIHFYGDFLSITALNELTDVLRGCLYMKSHVAGILDRFELSKLFGSITKDQLLDTMF